MQVMRMPNPTDQKPSGGIKYRAVVKYPIDATDKEKLRALRDGLSDIVCEMIEEQGVSLAYVEDALDDALSAAQESYAYRIQTEGENEDDT